MEDTTHEDPFVILREIDRRNRENALGLPQQVKIKDSWSGIGFRIGKTRLVSAVGDVNEILYFPRVTKIPGTKRWIKGMANVRGNLMPIIDLRSYLGTETGDVELKNRILVINHGELWAGLIVDEVMGLKHFYEEEKLTTISGLDTAIHPYIVMAYKQNNIDWCVFSMLKLVGNPEFFQVAA